MHNLKLAPQRGRPANGAPVRPVARLDRTGPAQAFGLVIQASGIRHVISAWNAIFKDKNAARTSVTLQRVN